MNPPARNPRLFRILWAASALFIVYGTTLPFRFGFGPGGWSSALASINWNPLGVGGDISLPDLVQNVLLFLPVGFLGFLAFRPPRGASQAVSAIAAGTSLSIAVEFLQLFTVDRVSSLSDVVCNAAGTVLGALAALGAAAWAGSPRGARPAGWLAAPSAYPALVFTGLVLLGAWIPFDVSLDVSAAVGKVRAFLAHPLAFSLPGDEGAAGLRAFLAAWFLFRWAAEVRPGWTGVAPTFLAATILAAAAAGLEATQVLFASRSPSVQDALASALGAWVGGLLARAAGSGPLSLRPSLLAIGAILAVGLSVALAGLYPFELADGPARWNWLPFRSEYADTSFLALANFLESALLLFPLGYLLSYLFPGRPAAAAGAASVALALAMSLAVEAAQAYIVGRHADITDVLGAGLGALAGSLAAARGGPAFRRMWTGQA